MDLRELGGQLKERREALGLSLDEVIQRTKISRRNIVAIEEGNREDLPHPVYSKGFIRNYARLLSLDMDEVEKILTLEFAEKEESQAEVEEALDDLKRDIRLHADAARSKSRGKLGVSVFIGFLLVVLIGLAVWLLPSFLPVSPTSTEISSNALPEERDAVSPGTGETSEGPSRNALDHPADTGIQLSSNAQTLGAEADKSSGNPEGEEGTSTSVGEVEREASAVPQAAEGADAGNASGEAGNLSSHSEAITSFAQAANENSIADTNKVIVTAREKCWLTGTADSSTKEVFLLPGDQIVFKFKDKLVLKLGNGGGVDVAFNGQPVSTGVPSGSVKTLVFP
jgi:cytoskeleton protein RodZ